MASSTGLTNTDPVSITLNPVNGDTPGSYDITFLAHYTGAPDSDVLTLSVTLQENAYPSFTTSPPASISTDSNGYPLTTQHTFSYDFGTATDVENNTPIELRINESSAIGLVPNPAGQIQTYQSPFIPSGLTTTTLTFFFKDSVNTSENATPDYTMVVNF